MTPAKRGTVNDFLGWLSDQVGVKESPANSNRQKFGEHYGWNGVAWCAEFIWCGLSNAGVAVPKTASAHLLIEQGDQMGRLVNEFANLRPGDIIGWNFDARSNQVPNIEHVSAAVAKPAGSSIEHIGGNTSASAGSGSQDNGGMVARKSYPSSYFVAAWRPDFADAEQLRSTAKPKWRKELEPGDKGSDVRLLQQELNQIAEANLDVDGEFGPLTEKAVKAYQKEKGWNVDGTVDLKLVRHLEDRIHHKG